MNVASAMTALEMELNALDMSKQITFLDASPPNTLSLSISKSSTIGSTPPGDPTPSCFGRSAITWSTTFNRKVWVRVRVRVRVRVMV
jgi:hypothetical protein